MSKRNEEGTMEIIKVLETRVQNQERFDFILFFFFKQKTAYEIYQCDWSSDVCSSDLPEKVYQSFLLGLLVNLQYTHEVKSNREAGYGRYDVMIIPKNKEKTGFVIELKSIDNYNNETLNEAADAALAQIEEKQYEQELLSAGIQDIVKMGIAFDGKRVEVRTK